MGFTRGVRCAVRFWVIFKITLHLIFAVTYTVRCNLEFSQNHNHTIFHFYSHMCSAVYKMRLEARIFFKFWDFLV